MRSPGGMQSDRSSCIHAESEAASAFAFSVDDNSLLLASGEKTREAFQKGRRVTVVCAHSPSPPCQREDSRGPVVENLRHFH